MKITDYVSLAAIAGVAYLVYANKGTLQSIGSGITGSVSSALNKIQSKVVKDASEN